jgi:uncharacterized NAD(P)/FAD-binding protein YdhS
MAKNEVMITIVGAGASGILSLSRLVSKLSPNSASKLTIRVFEKSGSFGPGLAYSTPLNCHILNMNAGTMSAVIGEPDHFIDWLKENEQRILNECPHLSLDEKAYPPRKVYGYYLEDIKKNAQEKAKQKKIRVELIKGEVIDIQEGAYHKEVLLRDGRTFQADFVIMALGHFPPTILYELRGTDGYLPYPWPAQVIMDQVSPREPVCILGAGLSAIDTLFTLLENDHREKIYLVSRTGFIPKVQGKSKKRVLQFITQNTFEGQKLSLEEVGGLLVREIERAEGKGIDWLHALNPAKSIEEILEEDIATAKAGPIPSESVLLATAEIISNLWNSLSHEEQRKFDCDYKSIWTVYRHPMPIVNAEKILHTLKSGQLKVLSGFKCVQYLGKGQGFLVDIQTRYGMTFPFRVRSFINATGQGLAVARYDDTLVQNLIRQGTIAPHPSGGIYVDFDASFAMNKDGKPLKWLFVVGEMTRGTHFFTNAISQLSLFADRIAGSIAKHMNKD